ncbi:hypothetical protein SKAU_G00023220 [Synaphobranchus kaupii]|uniref:Optineurin n=1 Tax=Synaphobranchus kaupii TaxID=118154 RepID=A0A9Q1GCB2_SYNKA|nr:hypothetical protein SKAU_G00023220 [Synaphobranchus kaupii]
MASNLTSENGANLLGSPDRKPEYSVPHTGTLEEDTLRQMNVLIKENRELKEALKRTNTSMKEKFEGLAAWKEKQKEERDFLERKLEEAKERVSILTKRNEELRKKLQALEGTEGDGEGEAGHWSSEVEALKALIARLQAEKSDLVAMNSELQLKMRQSSPEDSFIEIRIAEGEVDVTKDYANGVKDSHTTRSGLTMSRQESEEQTVSQLLQSLRKETQRVERLELELLAERERISDLESDAVKQVENATQTSLPVGEREGSATVAKGETQQEAPRKESDTELESLKGQMTTLHKELQEAQTKLNDAEDMKKSLHDRCRDMEQDLATLQTQLVEKQQVQTENQKLKLQVESMQSMIKMEQKKAEDERKNMAQVKDEYTQLYEDYNGLKQDMKKKETVMSNEEVKELQARLDSAEQALVVKQQKIDEMKQEIFKNEKELESISVFQMQAEVYSADFYAERAAREKIHEEKERLVAQLEFMKKQNNQLQEEMESIGRQNLNEMQRRHVPRGANPRGGGQQQGGGGAENIDIPEHACPKCNELLPDLDSLQIHIMDCII